MDVSTITPLIAVVGESAAGDGHITDAAISIQATFASGAITAESGMADGQSATLVGISVTQIETIAGAMLHYAVVDGDGN